MTPTQDRPKWVDDLIRAFGAEMGLDDLSFDESNLFELGFDGTEIAVFYVPPTSLSGAALLLKSALDMPVALPAPFLALLATTNLTAFSTGKGFVAGDLDFGCWVWTDRIDLAGLTAAHLRNRLEQAANAARDWATALPALIDTSKPKAAVADNSTGTEDSSILFRL